MQGATGVVNRALTPLGDKAMLSYVAEALAASGSIGRVFVVGDVPGDANLYERVSPGETLMDNLLAGIRAACAEREAPRLLISTSDIPFLTPNAVDDFVAQAVAADADFGYSIIPMARCREAFPQMKRTTLRLREGVFTGGNLMLVNPEYVLGRQETILRAYAARKRVGQIGAMLGWGLLARIVVAQMVAPRVLTIPMLEAGVARLLGSGCRARAIVTQYAEIGTDIDSPADIALAREMLARR